MTSNKLSSSFKRATFQMLIFLLALTFLPLSVHAQVYIEATCNNCIVSNTSTGKLIKKHNATCKVIIWGNVIKCEDLGIKATYPKSGRHYKVSTLNINTDKLYNFPNGTAIHEYSFTNANSNFKAIKYGRCVGDTYPTVLSLYIGGKRYAFAVREIRGYDSNGQKISDFPGNHGSDAQDELLNVLKISFK